MRTRRGKQESKKVEYTESPGESSDSDGEYEPKSKRKTTRKSQLEVTDNNEEVLKTSKRKTTRNSQLENMDNEEVLKDCSNKKKRSSPVKKTSVPEKKVRKEESDEKMEFSSDGDEWEDVDMDDEVLVINLDGKTLDPAEARKKRLAALKRRENLERKNRIKGEHIKEVVDVIENLCKGFVAFKNGSTDSEKDIKKIVKLKSRSIKDKAEEFFNNIDGYIEELQNLLSVPIPCLIPCSNEIDEEFKKAFYSYIALNTINIECRVCSPCNPPSLLLNVKNPKFKGVQRYFFIEIFNKPKEEWIPIDVVTKEFGHLTAEPFNDPNIMYMFAIDSTGVLYDVIGRYTKSLISHKFRQSRLPYEAMIEIFKIYSERRPTNSYYRKLENSLMLKNLEEQGFPDNISDFKGHPLYCLDKDILKAEAVWPPDTKPIGKVGKYNIYPRKFIKQLYTSVRLLMDGLDVKEGEEPIKIVGRKPRPTDRPDMIDPEKKPLYGLWQTVKYKTPKLVDGQIEPNKYGNLYVFKPWMIPEDCVHITQYTEYKKYADELGIQVVPAVVGFDTKRGKTYPVCKGFVVQKKDVERLTSYLDENMEKIRKARNDRNANKVKRLIERQINQANILNPTQE
uniref:DNA repair protein complementing XP-C cells n=1 Tax=Strongyloides papillosus TaxID=174720 RepID=A0A0N5CEC1_STREA